LTKKTGAYAEYLASSTKMLIHKPKELPWAVAAGIPEVSQSLFTFLSLLSFFWA